MSIRRRTLAALSLVALLAVLLAACGKAEVEATSGVDLGKAWARTSQPGAKSGAAYLTIEAHQTDKLESAAVDAKVAGMVQLHQTVLADGSPVQGRSSGGASGMNMPGMDMSKDDSAGDGSASAAAAGGQAMTMREVNGGVAIPSGRSFVLAPGGYHLMLMDLAQPLTAGQKFTLTLHFQKAGDQTVEVEVRDDAP